MTCTVFRRRPALVCESDPVSLATPGLLLEEIGYPGSLYFICRKVNETFELSEWLTGRAFDPSAREKCAKSIEEFFCTDGTAGFARIERSACHTDVVMDCRYRVEKSRDERLQSISEPFDFPIDDGGAPALLELTGLGIG